MPTQSDVLLLENYSSASQNRKKKKNHFKEVSVKAELSCDDIASECAEVSRGEEGK